MKQIEFFLGKPVDYWFAVQASIEEQGLGAVYDKVAALEAELARKNTALDTVPEWVYPIMSIYPICPVCGATKDEGHTDDCEKWKRIREARNEAEALEAEVTRLRAALDAVPEWHYCAEWDKGWCLVCGASEDNGHADDCEKAKRLGSGE